MILQPAARLPIFFLFAVLLATLLVSSLIPALGNLRYYERRRITQPTVPRPTISMADEPGSRRHQRESDLNDISFRRERTGSRPERTIDGSNGTARRKEKSLLVKNAQSVRNGALNIQQQPPLCPVIQKRRIQQDYQIKRAGGRAAQPGVFKLKGPEYTSVLSAPRFVANVSVSTGPLVFGKYCVVDRERLKDEKFKLAAPVPGTVRNASCVMSRSPGTELN